MYGIWPEMSGTVNDIVSDVSLTGSNSGNLKKHDKNPGEVTNRQMCIKIFSFAGTLPTDIRRGIIAALIKLRFSSFLSIMLESLLKLRELYFV